MFKVSREMRALDDIVIGFFMFFIIERAVRLFSNMVIEPWAQTKTENPNVVENWKIAAELITLVIGTFLIFRYRKMFQKLNSS
jgi:hypothetical protein